MAAGNIVCFGEVLWDMLPSGPKPGGAPANVAIHLKKQGLDPTLISRVGIDADGDGLLRFLKESGLDTGFIQKDESLPTSKVLVHLDDHKNATYEICEPVAWDNIQMNAETTKAAESAELILFGSLAARNPVTQKTLLEILDISLAKRLLDVNLRPPFDNRELVERLLLLSDLVKMNEEELNQIASWHNTKGKLHRLVEWLSEQFQCPEVCITRGDKGALFYTAFEFYEHPGYKVNPIDTVGSGDAFLAALVNQLLKNHSPFKSLEYACATGAFVASHKGAVPDYSEKDIEDIIKKSP